MIAVIMGLMRLVCKGLGTRRGSLSLDEERLIPQWKS